MSYITSGGSVHLQLQAPTSAYYGQIGFASSSTIPGPTGPTGYTGYTGYTGPTGPSSGGSTGPLGFIVDSDNPYGTGLAYQRDLVTFYDPDGPKTIRKWLTYNHTLTGQPMFAVQLSSFTPNLSSTTLPASLLSWDVPCTGFSVSVDNPSDFLSEYISSVYSIEQTSGVVSTLDKFIAGSKSSVPAGGVSWTQAFSTNGNIGVIRSTSTGILGGSAGANVKYNINNGSETPYTVSNSTIYVTWETPTLGINLTPLSGKTFLDSYTSTTYVLSVGNINTPSNYVHQITGVQGTVSNITGNGTFTFTTPIYKDNTGIPRTVSSSTTFTRPTAVTGTSYSAILNASSAVSASFTYPSFWLYTIGTGTAPVRSDIISGNSFVGSVNVLGDQANTFIQSVNNTAGLPRAFWLGIKSDINQPTSFKTGSTSALLSDVAVTTGNSVLLSPDSAPGAYNAVSYILYGITVQSGIIYMSIT